MKSNTGKIFLILCFVIFYGVFPLYAQNFWQQTRGPEGGSITWIKVNNEEEIFATIEENPILYKSTDAGNSWVKLPDMPAEAYAMTITTAGDIFIGNIFGRIYRSQDKGQSWQAVNNGMGSYLVSWIEYDRINQRLFAGTYYGGIYRSTDNGDSWQAVNNGLVNYQNLLIREICILTTDNSIYVAAGGYDSGSQTLFGSIFKSSDGGDSWQQINGNLGSPYVEGIVAINSNQILVSVNGAGIYKTTNGGTDWNPANNGLGTSNTLKLYLGPNNSIYLGSYDQGLFSSIDFGENWITHPELSLGGTVFDMTYDTFNQNIFVGMAFSGVYRSTDNGSSWSAKNTGIVNTYLEDIAVSSNNTDVFTVAYDAGIFKSVNGGLDWAPVNTGLTDYDVMAIALKQNLVFAGAQNHGVFKSADNGNTWVQSINGMGVQGIYKILIPSNGMIFAGGYGSIYRSNDDGSNWSRVYLKSGNAYVSSMVANEQTSSIFVGFGNDSGIVRSNLNGLAWNPVNTGLTNKTVRDMAVTLDGTVWACSETQLFYSANNGDNWQEINVSSYGIQRISSIRINRAGHLFLGVFSGGVYRSIDNGISWEEVSSGLITKGIISFEIDGADYLYAGVMNNGIFKSVQSTVLPTPNLDLPADGATAVAITPTLSWNAVAAADKYQIQVCLDNSFAGGIVADITGISTTSYQVNSGLNGNTTYYWRVRALNSSASSNWSAIRQFTTIDLPPAPTLLAPSNGTSGISLHPTFTWNSSVSGTYRLQISFYSDFSSLIFDLGNISTTSYTYEGADLRLNTTYYWRVDVTSAGLTSPMSGEFSFTTQSYPATYSLDTYIDFPSKSSPSQFVSTDYRIFGIPGNDSTLLGDLLGGTAGSSWQAYWDNGAASNYLVKYALVDNFRTSSGRAFWLVANGSVHILKLVKTAELGYQNSVMVPVHSGWNLITNPFASDVNWVTVQDENLTSEPIIEFTGAAGMWQDRTVMKPFVGYYFYSTKATSLRIPYSAVIVKPATKKLIDWQVTIKTAAAGIEDNFTRFGVAESAGSGLDELDFRKPRTISADLLTACFYRPEWDADYPDFATDIRQPFSDSEIWSFRVHAGPQQQVKLTFADLDRIPAECEVYLIDKRYSRSIDLRAQSDYNFVMIGDQAEFEVAVGSEAALRECLSNLIPDRFGLGQNFPNPFNPVTTIPVALPRESRISLIIYNLLGQQIKILYDGILPAGVNNFVWNGTDLSGIKIPSGIYLYRLRTDKGLTFTGKMVLLK